jgi:hypothetical protein
MINKNWPNDARHECEVTQVAKDIKDYFAKEMEILDEAEDEIEEAGYFEEEAGYFEEEAGYFEDLYC